jgi:predicted nucleotidyltransferase
VNTPREVEEEIHYILRHIVEGYAPQRIILFGSYVNGQPDGDSDLDLLIIKATSERPMDRHLRVRRLASNPRRRLPFDPLVLTPEEIDERLRMGDQFIRDILAQGEVLYES